MRSSESGRRDGCMLRQLRTQSEQAEGMRLDASQSSHTASQLADQHVGVHLRALPLRLEHTRTWQACGQGASGGRCAAAQLVRPCSWPTQVRRQAPASGAAAAGPRCCSRPPPGAPPAPASWLRASAAWAASDPAPDLGQGRTRTAAGSSGMDRQPKASSLDCQV